MFELLACTKAGVAALREVAIDLRADVLPIARVLRNVRQHDATRARAHVLRTLRPLERSSRTRRRVARRLSGLRVHPDLFARLEKANREAPEDARSVAAVTGARHALREIDAIKRELIETNLRLVVSVASRYEGRGLALPDLVQEGNIGLMLAIDKFDHRRGFRLSTYAVWWIRHMIQRALANQASTIRLPVHLLDDRNKVLRTRRRLEHADGSNPGVEEIANAAELPAEKVERILALVREPLSLDAPVVADGDVLLVDLVANDASPHAEDQLLRMDEMHHARSLLDRLSERERKVIERRFGLDGEPPETLAVIGASMSLTRERIRQIEGIALQKLRRK